MTKREILDQIRITARANSGVPLGQERFSRETSIRKTDWYGRYWVRWSDALAEAGFIANVFQEAYLAESLLIKLLELTRELGHFPLEGDLRLKAPGTFPFLLTRLSLDLAGSPNGSQRLFPIVRVAKSSQTS